MKTKSKSDILSAEKVPRSKKYATVLGMMEGLGLSDEGRCHYPKGRDYTYWSQIHGSYSRLDVFLVLKIDFHSVTESRIEPITLSDHGPIKMIIHLDQEKLFTYWGLNISILNDPLIQQELRGRFKEYLDINDGGYVTSSVLWDGAKQL